VDLEAERRTFGSVDAWELAIVFSIKAIVQPVA
jgi:hypothetical protein